MTRQHNKKTAAAAAIALIAAATLHLPKPAAADAATSNAAADPATASAAAGSAAAVLDSTPPAGAVGGLQSPVDTNGTLNLLLQATDNGTGLANAEAQIEGVGSTFVRLGSGICPEHPASNGQTFSVLPVAGCPEAVTNVAIPINVGATPGPRQLQVRVTDAAGNTATLVNQTINVQTPTSPGTNVVTVGIANPGAGGGGGGGSTGSGSGASGSGGVLGTSTSGGGACLSPKLSMKLYSKPLRYTKHHIPVLRPKHLYRYTGRLTCLPTGAHQRVSAPTGTKVQVLNMVNHRILRAGRGSMTVHKGNLSAQLSYTTNRTIIFRYTLSDGESLQIEIPIKIAPNPSRYTGRVELLLEAAISASRRDGEPSG